MKLELLQDRNYLEILNPSDDPHVTDALLASENDDRLQAMHHLRKSASVEAAFLRGLTLYREGEKQKALQEFKAILGKPNANFLTAAFHDAILEKADAATEMYGGSEFTKFFKTASQSVLFRDMHTVVNNTIAAHPPSNSTFTMVDLGLGTGAQVESIIKWIPEKWPHVKRAIFVGVEPSQELAEIAKARIEKAISDSPLTIKLIVIPKKAQDLDADFSNRFPPFNIVNATASIHHMDKEAKVKLLKTVRSWDLERLIITDADSDHDSDIPDLSYRLVANVTSFYDAVLNYMVSQDPNPEHRRDYEGFCFYDARNIVLETGSRRIEYHTTAKKWLRYLNDAGFLIVEPDSKWLDGVSPNNSSIEDQYLLTAKYKRPISFQITAAIKRPK
ncbi:MAG: GRAS family protein [Bacteriovoracia bacterium]